MKRLVLPILLCLFLFTGQALADSTITVSVIDGHSTVGGASVAALVTGASITGTTGPDGKVSLALPDGNYSFTTVKEGYAGKSVFARVGVDGNITIALDKLYGVSGTIVDSSTGLPVKVASVTITDKVAQKDYTGSTDAGGVFTVQVPNGYYSSLQLFVDTSKDQDYRLEFSVPDNRTLDAGASVNVEVTVRNNGSTKLTNVGLDLWEDDVPESMTADAQNRVSELAPGEAHRFTLKITARADASPETSQLYLRAVSDKVKTDKKP